MFHAPHASEWRREALQTNLWLVPTVQVLAASALFGVTYTVDRAAYSHTLHLPSLVNAGGPDAARQLLTGIAAAVITVVGLVFSIVIVALTLTSTQFGPRMLRNFIGDRGTQVTLGTFVATFVFTILTLGSVGHGARGDFVPRLSITVTLALVLASLGLLIYFIHHVATSIQLPEVIAGIAGDLSAAIDLAVANDHRGGQPVDHGMSLDEILARLNQDGATVPAPTSGYLQFVVYDNLVAIAADAGVVIQLLNRPGHFVTAGLPLARVWPSEDAAKVARRLARSHATGPHRTHAQDLAFAIDQLVEIAIRALSPAVNDTFTALTCIDWLGDGLCKLTARWQPATARRDKNGNIRVITADQPYERFVERSFDKIRQASRGMPAVMIRQLDALTTVLRHATTTEQRVVLLAQADMIWRSAEASVPEQSDLRDIRRRYDIARQAASAETEASAARSTTPDTGRDTVSRS